jgi:hypothetical protein
VVQAALARLEALEKDNAGAHEPIDLDDDDEASPDEDEQSEFLLKLFRVPQQTQNASQMHQPCDSTLPFSNFALRFVRLGHWLALRSTCFGPCFDVCDKQDLTQRSKQRDPSARQDKLKLLNVWLRSRRLQGVF